MMGEVIRVSGRAPDVGEFLREAMLSQRFADVALCCPGGQRFLAHRLVLSAASPYLQEVLLAHSRSVHCEPITVILAEVEAPELAALLGFVYTGTATVPRPRLNAFLRAAEALHIRLPPVPLAMCAEDSKDDVKDVKISPKYLQCEQYPSDTWYRPHRVQERNKKEYGREEIRERPVEMINFVGSGYSCCPTTWTPSYPGVLQDRVRGESMEKERSQGQLDRRYPVVPEVQERREQSPLICDSKYQEVGGTDLGLRDYRAGYKVSEDELERTEGTMESQEQFTRSQVYGEDLSCGEGCCRWRTPRRHVANRVTASPWKQIVRPHHSPKLQPIVLQHADEEVVESTRVPEPPRPTTSSISPIDRSSRPDFYGFEVPTCESFPARPTETNPDARIPDFYAPLPFTPKIPSTTVRSTETFFQQNIRVDQQQPGAKGYFPQPQKPELSHPISRLCDTIETEKTVEEFTNLETRKVDEEPRVEEKVQARLFVNSDSNNNDAIAGGDLQQRRVTSQEDHRCDQCGKTFVTRASLKVHSRTHSGEKPFRCADCGKQFSQLRNYKYHRSVHEGTREFAATCPECGKYFNDRGYLSSHMKIHRNRKEYGCAECGKSFNQRVAYNMHVRIHTGVKPHQCEQCGKAFSRKMLLKQHLRTHSGERPYQCQVCQKAFADRSNMTLHTRLHSGLKPYQCTLCSKAFTKKHHLKTHLNYHTGTKPYSCPNCGLRFSQSSNMRTHYKKCAVNNPGGVNGQSDVVVTEMKTEKSVSGTSDALTPPNSDQESSILTPIPKNVGDGSGT